MRVGGTVVPPKVSIAPPRGGSGTGTATPPRPSSLQPNQWKVFLIVMAGLGISAMPFFFRSVREAESRVHELRELNIDAEEKRKMAKDMSRDSRLHAGDIFKGIRERREQARGEG